MALIALAGVAVYLFMGACFVVVVVCCLFHVFDGALCAGARLAVRIRIEFHEFLCWNIPRILWRARRDLVGEENA